MDSTASDIAEIKHVLGRILPLLETIMTEQKVQRAEINEIKGRLDAMKASDAAFREEMKDEFARLRERIARIEGRVEGVNDRLSDINARLPVTLGYQPPARPAAE